VNSCSNISMDVIRVMGSGLFMFVIWAVAIGLFMWGFHRWNRIMADMYDRDDQRLRGVGKR
jgi:hypothetical protein